MEAPRRRLGVVAAHFDTAGAANSGRAVSSPTVSALAQLLDHDNLELRKRMKDFFQSDDIYIPR